MINELTNPDSSADSITNNVVKTTRLRLLYIRYFFVLMASLFPVLVVIGFTPDYQLISSGAKDVHWFLHVHGAIMTTWLLVFLAQAVLAAKGNFRFHRKLGLISVAFGIIILLSIAIAIIRAKIVYSPPVGDANTWGVFSLQLYGFVLFGLFFTGGIVVRKNAAAHKRLLLMATLITMQAAVDRTSFLPGIQGAVYVRFIYLDILLIPLFIYDFFTLRCLHKITVAGVACIVALQFFVTTAANSPAWDKFAFGIFAPFMEHPVEIKLSNAQIDPVLGDYGDKKWKLTVFRDSGKVYLKLPNGPKFEITPTSETEWFMKVTTWRISFMKSADGSVTKIINKQPNLTWDAPRFRQQ